MRISDWSSDVCSSDLVEILRLHYAETLVHWFRRFSDRRQEIAALYDERFCRMWEFYLATSESAFRAQGHMNFQIQLAKRDADVPLTRDYITDQDRKSRDISSPSVHDRELYTVYVRSKE